MVGAVREALATALRQWRMHANDSRDDDEYHPLGEGDDMEDRIFQHAQTALRRLGEAADSVADARLAHGTAFECSALVVPLDENGCSGQVVEWVAKSPYRSLIHRHDGTFTAADESERKYMRADTIPLLADALMNWPAGAEELPPTRYVRVEERHNAGTEGPPAARKTQPENPET